MMLSIVIPAHDEEAAIADVLRVTKTAKEFLLSKKYFDSIEIIVVDDGSHDNTKEILDSISGIQIITHTHTKGYGAALKDGFRVARGDILSFLDADTTYDPCELPQLVETLRNNNAHIAIGSRMHENSHMPTLRKIGNRIFTYILHLRGGKHITDVTSGMRVLYRATLETLLPLPDGLDFTTVMTAKALRNKSITIVESPISYKERVGTSKLKIFIDGPKTFWELVTILLSPRK